MTAPTRSDAITALVFVGAGAVAVLIVSVTYVLAQRILGFGDLSDLLEAVGLLFAAVAGGYGAVRKFRSDTDG